MGELQSICDSTPLTVGPRHKFPLKGGIVEPQSP
jgi:hypothetical protein